MRPVVVFVIRMYQMLSRYTPATCRFTPTCSEYAAQAVLKHGVMKGSWMAIGRIVRCHPWTSGGYDPVM